jgi:hypothetical protein
LSQFSDEKTQIQALDRTKPVSPIIFDATEKRNHDYLRHDTTKPFAVLNVGTSEAVKSSVSANPLGTAPTSWLL